MGPSAKEADRSALPVGAHNTRHIGREPYMKTCVLYCTCKLEKSKFVRKSGLLVATLASPTGTGGECRRRCRWHSPTPSSDRLLLVLDPISRAGEVCSRSSDQPNAGDKHLAPPLGPVEFVSFEIVPSVTASCISTSPAHPESSILRPRPSFYSVSAPISPRMRPLRSVGIARRAEP